MSDMALRPQDLGIGHLFERVRDAVVVADALSGRVVLWNAAATEIFGYSVSEALGMNLEELVPERLRERHRAGLARYRGTGHGPYIDSHELLELPAVRKTGGEIRIEMSLSPIAPIRDAGEGDRRYALAVVRDITERKRAEEALRESEARFHALARNALDIVMVTDAQGNVLYVSPSIERVLGYTPEEMLGTSTAGYVHPDDSERALAELSEAVSKPGVHPIAVETRVRHKDGSWRHLEGIANNLLDDPVIGGMVFNHRDVTERKRAEEEVRRLNAELEGRVRERTARLEAALDELKASEERYRLLVESAEDYAIFMVDSDGRVLDWNAGAERIFGYRESEIVGEPGSLLFTPEDVWSGAPERELRKAREEGRAVDERRHLRKDGSRFWASGFVRPIRDEAGNLRGFAKVARDVTERKTAEDRLRFLAKTGELLSSSLDHRATLAGVAKLAVPTLADWCAVDILEQDGYIERLAVEHQDPEKVSLALELQERYPSAPDASTGIAKVLRTGRYEFHPEVTGEMLETAARDEGHLELMRKLGFTSVMIVPMSARGRTLGALTLVSSEKGHVYDKDDLELAHELARRAALAVDNARLYEHAQREIAERKWAEEELLNSRDQLQVILGGVADGITAQDPTGQLLYANEAAARMVGYPSAAAFMSTPLREVMRNFEARDEEGRPFPPERLPGRRALLDEEGAEEVLRFRVIETGEERWSIVRATPIFDERGSVRMAVNIFRDITESKRAEEALRDVREAERRRLARDLHDGVLQDLSYTAAAMSVIMIQAKGTNIGERLQGAIDAVRRAAEGLRAAVNDLRLEERDRAFPDLVESLVSSNGAMARGAEISLKVEEAFPTRPLGPTGTQMLRIIQEALTNARRHSGARNVIVNLGVEEDELVAEVADDGQGFGVEATPGVGLDSMHERAAAIGAKLNFESQPGRGTTVRLRVTAPQGG